MSFSLSNVERLNRIVRSLETRAGNHDPRSNRVKEDAVALIRDLVRENVRLEQEIDDLLTEGIGTELAALDVIGKATRHLQPKKH
jgi:hypothetical protein